jgi:peptidoglycan DL-endopeptidase CwlO
MSRRLISIFICCLFFISTSVTVFAEPLINQDDTNIIATNEEKIEELEESISKLDDEIVGYMYQMEQLESEIESSEERVSNKEMELKEAQEKIKVTRDACNKRLLLLYESGYESYIFVLLESQSFSDFISRITTIRYLMEYDKKVISELRIKEEDIETQRKLLVDENNRLLSMKSELGEKLDSINSLKDRQMSLIESLKQNNQKLKTPVVAFPLPSRGAAGSASSFGYDVVEYAKNFLGVPYRWTGTSPETGFDCSGFTQYVFKHFGILLNRTSSAQAQQGTKVSRSELQPGDLIFIGFPIHHVGIYVGNDHYIHAPRTGDVVKISSLKYSKFNTGRRVRP